MYLYLVSVWKYNSTLTLLFVSNCSTAKSDLEAQDAEGAVEVRLLKAPLQYYDILLQLGSTHNLLMV